MARRTDVVRIESGNSRGTGFLIDDDRVLTALHVVGKVQGGRLAFHGRDLVLTAAVGNGPSLRFPLCAVQAEDVEFDERLDWACIHVRGALSGATDLPFGELTESEQSATWHTYGFPGSNPVDGKATTGTVASVTATLRLGGMRVGVIQLFSQEAAAGVGGAVHGYSGAPVMVDDRVVGIVCTADVNAETGRATEGTLYAIPLTALGIALPTVECPYPGLRPYDTKDARRFFGRNAEVEQVLDRLRRGERQILVVGPSGSGKSSFVKAGTIPRLSELDGRFEVRILQPGAHPCETLLQTLGGGANPKEALHALLAASKARHAILVIDQLEELFTQCEDRAERQRFAEAYETLLSEPSCTFILTIRADFYGDLIDSALWPQIGGRTYQLELPPLRDRALAEAIEAPARGVSVTIEASLREKLIADAASEPGALPLLQVTLQTLWGKRKRHTLSLDDYLAIGDGTKSGLAVALEHTADAVLHGLRLEQQSIARRIFLRLVNFGEGRASTRRQQPMEALMTSADVETQFVATLDALTNGKLVIRDMKREGESLVEVVDMAHEALISAWPTLAEWIASRRADEQRRRTLEGEVREWVGRGRGNVGLLDAVQLAEAEAWVKSDAARDVGYGKELTDFLVTSRRALEQRERRRRRRLYITIAALAVFSVVVSSMAIFAFNRAREAERQRSEARRVLGMTYMDHGRQLVVDGRPQQALPFLVAAREQGIENDTLRMLYSNAAFGPRIAVRHADAVLDAELDPKGLRLASASSDKTARIWDAATGHPVTGPLEHADKVTGVTFSPDGTQLATTCNDHSARVWDAATGKPLTPPLEHHDRVTSVSFSPDGKHLATASWDHHARIWDIATGKLLTLPLEHIGQVYAVAFSPNGERIVTAATQGSPLGGWGPTVCIWDAATGTLLKAFERGKVGSAFRASFSPDGSRILVAADDFSARVWDAATAEPVTPPLQHEALIQAASFSPDGTLVVTASMDHTARVWEASTGNPLTPPLEHRDQVIDASLSPTGDFVVTASSDQTARVWDTSTGKPLTPWLEHERQLHTAKFSKDGDYVVTASHDKTARIWHVPNAIRSRVVAHQAFVRAASFTRDGSRLLTVGGDGAVRIWDPSTGTAIGSPIDHQHRVSDAAFSPDGTRVVTASDTTARVWDARTGAPVTPPLEHPGPLGTASFSPDGTRVVTTTAFGDGTARIWDAATGAQLPPKFQHDKVLRTASFSPDGQRIITASTDETARVWNATTGQPITGPLEHHGEVEVATFSPDGACVITASDDKTARIWDATNGKALTPPLEHLGPVKAVAFSPNGKWVATASTDTTARIWDARTGAPLMPPLEHRDRVNAISFSPDGMRVVTASDDKTAQIWDASTGRPLMAPFEHRSKVSVAAFSPDGSRIVTGGPSLLARLWSVPLDRGALAQWQGRNGCSPYVLANGTLLPRNSSNGCVTGMDAPMGDPPPASGRVTMIESDSRLSDVPQKAMLPMAGNLTTASPKKTSKDSVTCQQSVEFWLNSISNHYFPKFQTKGIGSLSPWFSRKELETARWHMYGGDTGWRAPAGSACTPEDRPKLVFTALKLKFANTENLVKQIEAARGVRFDRVERKNGGNRIVFLDVKTGAEVDLASGR